MVMIYFSGTGNSRYIAEQFAKRMHIKAYSIEQNVDFDTLLVNEDTIAVCYPIYGSCVPGIMRKFVEKYKTHFIRKKIDYFLYADAVFRRWGKSFCEIAKRV